MIVENEALTSSLTNFHSHFSSSHHISHSLAASSKLSHLSHRAAVVLSKHMSSVSVHAGLKCLRTWRSFMNSSLVDRRFDPKTLGKKRNRRNTMSINFSETYKLLKILNNWWFSTIHKYYMVYFLVLLEVNLRQIRITYVLLCCPWIWNYGDKNDP